MPKQTPASAFMIYVHKRKNELGRCGYRFQGTADAVKKLAPEWEAMSEEEKLPFRDEARRRKIEAREKRYPSAVSVSPADNNDTTDSSPPK